MLRTVNILYITILTLLYTQQCNTLACTKDRIVCELHKSVYSRAGKLQHNPLQYRIYNNLQRIKQQFTSNYVTK